MTHANDKKKAWNNSKNKASVGYLPLVGGFSSPKMSVDGWGSGEDDVESISIVDPQRIDYDLITHVRLYVWLQQAFPQQWQAFSYRNSS